TRPWDLAAFHIFGTDRIQHELWHLLDPTHPDHDPREAEAHAPEVIAFFERVDRCIGEILDTAGSGVNIVLLSDHGFGPIRSYLVFNNWLLSEGFLHLKRSVGSRLKYRLFRLGFTPDFCYRLLMRLGFAHLRHSQGIGTRYRIFEALDRIFLSLRDVDWARTVAYAKGNFGQIYLNVRGREPHGIVEPGRHYEETRERLIEALAAIPHPDREEPLFAEIYRGEEIYTGEQHALAPDILLLPGDMSFKALGSMDFITNRFIQPSYGQSGDHRMDGILVMHGVPFRRGYRIDARIPPRILDITPTILHLMGIPLPDDLDGEVLLDLFTERFRNERQITYAPAHTGGSGGTISPEEEEEVRKNLIRLGYLG
ncbi:MAG: phosphodiesterase, partial [Deltaproteobacteria bacterium]